MMLPVLTKIHSAQGGKIFEITINRPDVHNCVNGETARLLKEAWIKFREDDELTVAILHGAGEKSFCSGADLSALNELVNVHDDKKKIGEFVKHNTGPMGGTRIIQTKPVITMSHGYTYAGGLELFCHGHIRIAERQAIFSVACRRWGVPLADGGTVYLPRLIGLGNALPLIITGQRIRAKRAREIGLVWELTEKGAGLDRAFTIARQICEQPRDALMSDLDSAINGYHLSLEEALALEAGKLHPVAKSDSFKKGVERFLAGERFWFK